MKLKDKKRFARLNAAWRAGEKVDGLAFPYNSLVTVSLPDGSAKDGWIVGVTLEGPEPIYIVETKDGSGDLECPESTIRIKPGSKNCEHGENRGY